MISINTITSSTAALNALRQTNADLATAQGRIASGYRVNSAKDNASVWATAQSIRADLKAQDGVDSSIALTKGQVDAASTALSTIQDLLSNIKAAAAGLAAGDTANGNTAQPNNTVIKNTIATYVGQILAVAKSASIQGVNLLTEDGVTSHSVTATIGQDSGVAITMNFTSQQTLKNDGSAGDLSAVYTLGGGSSSITNTMAQTAIDAVNGTTPSTGSINVAIAAVTAYQTKIDNFSKTLGTQQDFLAKIKDIRTTALGALVDANMEEESAKVTALQVKQQLAYQAISIGNSSLSNVLKLFQ